MLQNALLRISQSSHLLSTTHLRLFLFGRFMDDLFKPCERLKLPVVIKNLKNCRRQKLPDCFKCHYDQNLDINFYTISYTIGLSQLSCQISSYYEHYNARFLDLYFREFSAAINFPCSNFWLIIGVNDVIFSEIPHGLKL